MKTSVILSGWVSVRKDELPASFIRKVRDELTITPFSFGREEVDEPIKGYRETKNRFRLPVAWAYAEFRARRIKLEVDDRTTLGTSSFNYSKLPDPHHETAADGQAEFIADLLWRCGRTSTVLADAPTGSGKTVSALSVAAQLGRKTLVIVPTVSLGRQWKKEIVKHLGVEPNHIGWVQQGKCDYRGKSIVIGIINSISAREYPDEFYKAFGTVIWDEVHIVGARSFSQSLGLFYAKHKIALTATPSRKDGCAALFLNYFGTNFVKATGDAVACDCVVVSYHRTKPLRPIKNKGVLLSIITKDSERNEFIVRWIRHLWKKGKRILAIGDRIEHLQMLMGMCSKAGITAEMGLFAGQRIVGWHKKSKRIAKMVVGKEYLVNSRLPHCPLMNGTRVRCARRAGDGEFIVLTKERQAYQMPSSEVVGLPVMVLKKEKVTEKDQDVVKRGAQIIFATYGMFKQGQDVPSLDAGIDVTPRSDGVQTIGRIRRRVKGKAKPVWITIRDVGIQMFENNLKSRIRDYRKAKVEVWTYGQKKII